MYVYIEQHACLFTIIIFGRGGAREVGLSVWVQEELPNYFCIRLEKARCILRVVTRRYSSNSRNGSSDASNCVGRSMRRSSDDHEN